MNLQDSLVSASSAASYFRRKVGANEGSLNKTVIESNNAKIDEFEQLLKEVGDMDNKVPASLVWHYWVVYEQGLDVQTYQADSSRIPPPPDDQIEWWKEYFINATIDDMCSKGINFITYGWSMVILNYIRHWLLTQKIEAVYSQVSDKNLSEKAHWLELSKKHRELWDGQLLPFWSKEVFQEINEKVSVIVSIRVTPKK